MNTVECYSKMTFYFILKQTGKNKSQIPSREYSVCMRVCTCDGVSSSNRLEALRANPAQGSADMAVAYDA